MFAADWLAKREELTPAKTAVIDATGGVRLTYRDLNQRARRLAAFCKEELGLQKGDRIAVLAQNRLEFLDLLFAAQKTGTILVPLNYRLKVNELAYLLQDSRPRVLFYDQANAAAAADLRSRAAAAAYVFLGEEREGASAGSESAGDVAYARILAASPSSFAGPQNDFDLEAPWLILYTGGTTGFPKGAVLSRRMVTWNAVNTAVSWGLTPDDVAPVFYPFFHTGGINVLTTPLVHLGGTLVLTGPFQARPALETIERERCTVISMVPTMFQMIMDEPAFPQADFSSVRLCISGGAPCPRHIYEAFLAKGVIFKQGYGLTEAGPNCFALPEDAALRKIGSVGRPVFHSEVRLVGEDGREVPPGEVGELAIRGDHLCSGYWQNPAATAEILRDGWLYTGDLARQDEEGFFYIVGRKKEMIISGGENVYPVEIEAVLNSHPKIAEAAVIGIPHEKWGEVPKAVVALRPGARAAAEEIISFCRERLAGYKVPKVVEFRRELPKSGMGKILKRELQQGN
ncbi:MAG: long-chain fatty acid--CoA ligase [Bacillota bacterium]